MKSFKNPRTRETKEKLKQVEILEATLIKKGIITANDLTNTKDEKKP